MVFLLIFVQNKPDTQNFPFCTKQFLFFCEFC